MAPLEGWYDSEESANPWKISGTFRGGLWASDPVEHMNDPQGQSSWIPAGDCQKLFRQVPPGKTSSANLPTQQIADGRPVQGVLQLRGERSNVLHPTTFPVDIKDHGGRNFSEEIFIFPDVNTAVVDCPPQNMYGENYVSSNPARLLDMDEVTGDGVNVGRQNLISETANHFDQISGLDSPRRITWYRRLNVRRNRETQFAAERRDTTGLTFWSTPRTFSALASDDTGDSLPSTRSESFEGSHPGTEVKMKQISVEQVPNLIPDRNGNMQGIREASTPGGVQAGEISQPSVPLENSQTTEHNRRGGYLDTKYILPGIRFSRDDTGQSSMSRPQLGMLASQTQQNSHIPFQERGGLNDLSGRNIETWSPPVRGGDHFSAEQLSLQVGRASPLRRPASASRNYLQDGSSQSPQEPHQPLYRTPLQHPPPQPNEQMVERQQSVRNIVNEYSCASLTPQQQFQCTTVDGTGQSRSHQVENSSWQHFMEEFGHDAAYKPRQLSIPHESPRDVGFEGMSPDASGHHPDLTPNVVLVIQQLQAAIRRLDVGTRTCIRDALYRLARSAKERRSYRGELGELDSITMTSCVTGESYYNVSRCQSETQTNHLDRSIASLLFNTRPFREHAQQPAQKSESASQPVAGVQSGPWQWSSTGMICRDRASSTNNCVEPEDGALRIPLGNPLDATGEASSSVNGFRTPSSTVSHSRIYHSNLVCADNPRYPDSYEPLGTQEHGVNIPLSSSKRPVVSTNEVLNFGRLALPSQSTMMIPEGIRPEGISGCHDRRELELDVDHSFGSESRLVNLYQQSGVMFHRKVEGDDLAVDAGIQENSRLVNSFYDGVGNFESKVPNQFTYPDGYRLMTVRNGLNGGQRFGPDMNSLTTSRCNDPSGKLV
ncbi:hypothetical protein R1flu_014717 [Riccia fluitans]|uniref:Uncharacterized protein n=1 Tax=Riccia fluitans TaxID=41844 RepID=A0ABD1YGW3_9MARC